MATSEIIRTGGGKFDPTEQNVYFLATNPGILAEITHDINHHVLVAVNELNSDVQIARIEGWIKTTPNGRLFLDSGVYNLATEYAKAHSVSMDIALSTSPQDIDGFEPLFERYVHLVRKLEQHLWGYIEIDQGGRENKIKTRARLEKLGLCPTPVYHPLNDGWDYFDYLAERYDRICFGNIVKANAPTRQRLIATAWERHRRYPNLWIHLLGLTPNQWLNALPINSGDSSSWLHPIRWTEFPVPCSGTSIGELGKGYRYVLTKDGGDVDAENGCNKTVTLCAYKSRMDMLCWRGHLHELNEILEDAPEEEVGADEKPGLRPSDKIDTYNNGTIRQVILLFSLDEYAQVMPRLRQIRDHAGVESNTDAVLKLIDYYVAGESLPDVTPDEEEEEE